MSDYQSRRYPDHVISKRCFVTIGATAPFDSLLRAVLEPRFLQALHDAQYTELRLQYGLEGKRIFDQKFAEIAQKAKAQLGIDITGFGFNEKGLQGEINALRGRSAPGIADPNEGIVISHAGLYLEEVSVHRLTMGRLRHNLRRNACRRALDSCSQHRSLA